MLLTPTLLTALLSTSALSASEPIYKDSSDCLEHAFKIAVDVQDQIEKMSVPEVTQTEDDLDAMTNHCDNQRFAEAYQISNTIEARMEIIRKRK